MITIQSANNALKQVYLDVLRHQLNNVDGLISKIEQTTKSVYGKEIIVPIYVNGVTYTLKQELESIYANIEISDKAIRVSQNSAGAFVNLLNSEMENLLQDTTRRIKNSFYGEDRPPYWLSEKEKYIPLQISGLKHLFDDTQPTLYGVEREKISPKVAHIKGFDPIQIQEVIDEYNDEVDFIVCSSNTKRKYEQYLLDHRQIIERKQLSDGFNYLVFNGNLIMCTHKDIPNNEIYLINSKDFKFHQLCDWVWIENENGEILKQDNGKPIYKATLVKYGNYMCEAPNMQIKIIID